MPTVSVNREQLFKRLGKNYTDEGFDELCFQFGIEIDDIVDDPEKGVTYKIDIGANRYDLLCIEGISRALNIFLGREKIPLYRLVPAKDSLQYKITVKPNTAKVRPFVVGAVLRNLHFTQQVYDSFIDLQDKLHQNLARKRTLASIGAHNLSTKNFYPFFYHGKDAKDIIFSVKLYNSSWISDVPIRLYLYRKIIRGDKNFFTILYREKIPLYRLVPAKDSEQYKITVKPNTAKVLLVAIDPLRKNIMLNALSSIYSYCFECYCKPFKLENIFLYLN
ncbi:unnamed protein product, partial [Meganyctiphanes norvegica]